MVEECKIEKQLTTKELDRYKVLARDGTTGWKYFGARAAQLRPVTVHYACGFEALAPNNRNGR